MKKGTYIIISFLLIGLVILYFSVEISFNEGCPPPDRPNNVPLSAVWKGDCDGGSWIELVYIKEDKVRFRIYRDWNGDLILDADFKYQDCGEFKLTEANWSDHIAYFGNVMMLYKRSIPDQKCRLEPIYPAFEEEK